jgi:hypothetical protein
MFGLLLDKIMVCRWRNVFDNFCGTGLWLCPTRLSVFPVCKRSWAGENAAQLFAVAWHLGTDIVFMAQDQISARKAARDTMDMLLPPAGPLLIEQVGGARWGLGLSLFWILLAYPDLSSSELVAGLVVGALTSNGSSSHIKFIGDDEPLDPAHDGEKAYHLGVLARLGVNVPPGFCLATLLLYQRLSTNKEPV